MQCESGPGGCETNVQTELQRFLDSFDLISFECCFLLAIDHDQVVMQTILQGCEQVEVLGSFSQSRQFVQGFSDVHHYVLNGHNFVKDFVAHVKLDNLRQLARWA